MTGECGGPTRLAMHVQDETSRKGRCRGKQTPACCVMSGALALRKHAKVFVRTEYTFGIFFSHMNAERFTHACVDGMTTHTHTGTHLGRASLLCPSYNKKKQEDHDGISSCSVATNESSSTVRNEVFVESTVFGPQKKNPSDIFTARPNKGKRAPRRSARRCVACCDHALHYLPPFDKVSRVEPRHRVQLRKRKLVKRLAGSTSSVVEMAPPCRQ